MSSRTASRGTALLVALLGAGAAHGAGQEPLLHVEGRVVEAGTRFGLASASVQVEGGGSVQTNVDGRFRLDGLTQGVHVLTARAYGYEIRRIELSVPADTTVLIELEPAPVRLDPLEVEGRFVTLQGEVAEGGTGRRLMDVEVDVEGRDQMRTDSRGRFDVEVPAGPPFRVTVRHFGFLPVRTVVSTFRDTVLAVELEPDEAVRQAIDVQVRRLEERARPLRSTLMPPLDREFMLSRVRATALDLVVERYGTRLSRIDCLLVDERQWRLPGAVARPGGGRSIGWSRQGNPAARLEELAHILAHEIERIEVLQYGQYPRQYMLRVYTRDFIREMVMRTGDVDLEKPRILPGFHAPVCL